MTRAKRRALAGRKPSLARPPIPLKLSRNTSSFGRDGLPRRKRDESNVAVGCRYLGSRGFPGDRPDSGRALDLILVRMGERVRDDGSLQHDGVLWFGTLRHDGWRVRHDGRWLWDDGRRVRDDGRVRHYS